MATKTVATRGGDDGGGVAVIEDLDSYPVLRDGVGDLAGVLEENAGRTLRLTDLDRVKVPTGGGQSFEVLDDLTGETDTQKAVIGILVHWRRVRGYWEPPKAGEPDITHDPPACSSADGRFPLPGGAFAAGGYNEGFNLPILVNGVQQHACRPCPMNEWGSDPKEGRDGKGCKERILLFVLQEGETLPTIVSVPPASLSVVEKFMVKLTIKRGAHYSGFQFRFGLTKQEKGGTPYSQVAPTLVGVLAGAQRGKPIVGSPAADALRYAEEFAALLSEQDLVDAATGNGRAASNGHIEGHVLPDALGGDFENHDQEATVGS